MQNTDHMTTFETILCIVKPYVVYGMIFCNMKKYVNTLNHTVQCESFVECKTIHVMKPYLHRRSHTAQHQPLFTLSLFIRG